MLISLCSNVARMAGMETTGSTEHWWPWFNISDPKSVTLQDYREWYSQHGSLLGSNITDCDLEREMSKVGFTYMHVHIQYPNVFHNEIVSSCESPSIHLRRSCFCFS